ncbi:hypothetical protein SE23_03045 [Vibrio sinaloensis]|uniref:hypothetical protein n=1 Tax=Photobacterium sp. (strain ATCC 43367) TaxID=379097 RepID=UPI00057C7193|nr:hypothetical protein [Vibrio sinaloensis]KIE21230.1 hypothetical protein SE23_03045 [Vibrio sinaloensis]
MKLFKIVGFLLITALTLNLFISTFSIFQLSRYLDLQNSNRQNGIHYYIEARHSEQISAEDRTAVTKLLAKELFILGHENTYYVDSDGNEKMFEPSEEDRNTRLLNFETQQVSITYIHEQLCLNALYITMLLVIVFIKGKLKKRIEERV